MPENPEDDPKVLKKRIAELEKETAAQRNLIKILQQLPTLTVAEAMGGKKKPSAAGGSRGSASGRGNPRGKRKPTDPK